MTPDLTRLWIGNPKPTTITNGVYSVYDNHRKIQPIPGRRIQSYLLLEFEGGGRFFNPFPPFHVSAINNDRRNEPQLTHIFHSLLDFLQ